MKITTALTLLLTLCGLGHYVEAASVNWGTPYELVTDTDIDLTFGPVVYAMNAGDNIGNEVYIPSATIPTLPDPKPVTISGQTINFEGIETVYGTNAFFGQIGFPFETFGDAVDHRADLGDTNNVTFNVRNFRSTNIPQVTFDPAPATLVNPPGGTQPDVMEIYYTPATGNSDLDSVLESQVFMDSRFALKANDPGTGQPFVTELTAGTIEIYLNNLTPGTDYQVQVIGGADDRTFFLDQNVIDPTYMETSFNNNSISPIGTLSDGIGGNKVENIGSFLDLDNDGIGHVTTVLGTFTADSVTQQIDFLLQRGRNAGISAIILTEASTAIPGDFDGDGFVGLSDLNILGANFNTMGGATLATGDANGDGNVDLGDLNILGANFNPPPAVSVPEPSAGLLALAGLAVFGRRRS